LVTASCLHLGFSVHGTRLSAKMTLHDSVIGEHCFVEDKSPRCYGEILMILCGASTLLLSGWCLHRMVVYQNEAKWGVRCFIIYLSALISSVTVLHSLVMDGSPWSLAASWLVAVQGSLFTVFFIKICIRTNADTFSLTLDWERCIEMAFLSVMLGAETAVFAVYLAMYYLRGRGEIDCHHPAFSAFSGIDVAQILLTIVAVYFMRKRIHRQHQSVAYPKSSSPDKRSMLIEPKTSPPVHSLSVQQDPAHFEQEQLGHIQMLQKSHQLLLMASFLFLSAAVAAAYESWNLWAQNRECNDFLPGQGALNEALRLTARITWLFVPSWLICHVFWVWPCRPKKYQSESSELRRRARAQSRGRIARAMCCDCCRRCGRFPLCSPSRTQSRNGSPRRFEPSEVGDGHSVNEKRERLISYEGDSRLALSEDDERGNAMRGASASAPRRVADAVAPRRGSRRSVHRGLPRECSLSSIESDSIGQSDIWDQHITTESVASPTAVSRSVTRQSAASPLHRYLHQRGRSVL